MPIYKESTKIGVIKREARILKKAYRGSTLVFGKEVFERTFTASGSITFPLSILSLHVIVVGGGAGGASLWNGYGAGGGGGFNSSGGGSVGCVYIRYEY